MKQNYQLTKYPSLFENTCWGCSKVGTYCDYGSDIYHNRNAFVEQYHIKSRVSELPTIKQRLVDNLFKIYDRYHLYDHVEHYVTTSHKFVSVSSPYIDKHNEPYFQNFLTKTNFKQFKPMYSGSTSTFIIDVSDGFISEKEIKITALHQFIEKLNHESNIDINVWVDENVEFPLHTAIETNQVDIVQSLLNHPRIKVNLKDYYKETPLYRAINNYQTEIVIMLLDHELIDPNIKTGEDWITALELSYEKKNMDCFKLLLQHPRIDPNLDDCFHSAHYPKNILHDAIEKHENVATELLLQHPRIDLNLKDSQNYTELQLCVRENNIFALNLLLNHPRVNVDVEDGIGEGILQCCVNYGLHWRKEMFSFLLKHPRVNVNQQNYYGGTLLHDLVDEEEELCFENKGDFVEIFNILIENPNFDGNIRNESNKTALDFACINNSTDWVHRLLPYSSLESVQRTYDAFSNAKSTDDASVSDEECTEEIKTILHDFIENCKREQREERYLTEQFCLSMIQPFVPTQLKRKNPLYLGPDVVKEISSYLQWSDISKKKSKELIIHFPSE